MLTLRNEKLWELDPSNRQTVKNREYQATQKWLTERFSRYNYDNDTQFESSQGHLRHRQLVRKHTELAKDYSQTDTFYRRCQRQQCIEWNRHMRDTEQRFAKLIRCTFDTTKTKSACLNSKYNEWVLQKKGATCVDKVTVDIASLANEVAKDSAGARDDLTDDVFQPKDETESNAECRGLPTIRSVSVDQNDARKVTSGSRDPRGHDRSVSSLSVRQLARRANVNTIEKKRHHSFR